MRWFRMHIDAVDNPKLRLLAFEDRWHYVALCCLKRAGLLDKADNPNIERMIAVKMGLQVRELEEVRRRLMEVELIDADCQPVGWAKRQYDGPAKLPAGESLDGYKGYVYFIGAKAGPVKIGYSKNPWARLKDFQTASADKLSLIATVRTTEVSESRVHTHFAPERLGGEWFERSPLIANVIKEVAAKRIKTCGELVSYVGKLRSNSVATTTDTDTDTDTDTKNTHTPKRTKALARPECVTADVWQDLLTHRKNLKAPLTATAWNAIAKEINKAGLTLDAGIAEMLARGWRGFKAEWMEGKNEKSRANYEQPEDRRRRELADYIARAEGRAGVAEAGGDARSPVLEGVWERSE